MWPSIYDIDPGTNDDFVIFEFFNITIKFFYNDMFDSNIKIAIVVLQIDFFVNTRTLVVIIHLNPFECTTTFSGITCILRCSMLT